MKKLVFRIFLVCFAMSGYAQTTPTTPPLWCLNGYTQSEAIKMVNDFKQNNHGAPTPTTVWFDMGTIGDIKALLESEKTRVNKPDGIRLYFGYDANRGQNTVILVSTYTNGLDANGAIYHKDYFDHDQSLVPSNKGKISNVKTGSDGALLFTVCPTLGPPPPCPCLCMDDAYYQPGPNQITRKYAQEMVGNFGKYQFNSSSEWFSLDVLKNLYDVKYTGVRVYFARRTQDDLNPDYRDKDAFVLENTKTVIAGTTRYEQDVFNTGGVTPAGRFAPTKIKPQTVYAPLISRIRSKLDAKTNAQLSDKQLRAFIDTDGVDEGELCPDHCDTSSPLYINITLP
ncbi:hypothetical protein BEL04_19295 [Mucilaginibacter sp. PPCGB 2223]|uniref:hypothetical protein n=1 Tax=Mucilaginibacter sp. PPCGB 2223 TaxID=1886027 RepID=UPI0008255E41|nr:hypothetical protein [Mucilaginibacter sp. PPCGB 2223]OCX50872.1 hypothetical protein BEL04_19295 [Mucilaginibacter sp. PPCGB 2223]